MRKYGIQYKHHNNIDNHPSKGYVNWWEYELGDFKSKKTERQKGKKLISEELYSAEVFQ